MSQRYIGGVVTETTNVAQSPWTGEWTQQAALQGFAGAQAPLKVANSLRFRSSASAYLSRTPSVAGNRTTWTLSLWKKFGDLTSSSSKTFGVFDGTNIQYFEFGSNKLNFGIYNGASQIFQLVSTQVFRDPSSWYHFVIAFDSTQATAANRVKIYVNGTQITAFDTANYPSQNYSGLVNSTNAHAIAAAPPGAYFATMDGYLADINFIDGQALPPTAFGTFSKENGVWSPITYTGTYGTNGFKLNFSNGTSTTTLGYDSSGNGNNWTTNNISLTAGSTYDWMIDSPTKYPGSSYGVGNYCVLNPLNPPVVGSIANANSSFQRDSQGGVARNTGATGTFGISSGKWYFELIFTAIGSNNGTSGTGDDIFGVISTTAPNDIGTDYQAYSLCWCYQGNGNKSNGSSVAYGNSLSEGDIVGVALDLNSGKIFFSKNGTWQASGDPAAGTNAAFTNLSGYSVTPVVACYNNNIGPSRVRTANFGQRPFAYTPPSGYKSLCTQNLPGVTIQNGAAYMGVSLWNGGNTTPQNITGVSFTPDFAWVKQRNGGGVNLLWDSVRAGGYNLQSQSTAAESTYSSLTAGGISGNTTGGIVVAQGSVDSNYVNGNGGTYVAWQWKAGGTAVTNTAGSITSQVSANTTSGFSVVTWTCNNTANQSIGHGLGVAPSLVIVKDRDQGSGFNWNVWFTGFTANEYLQLNTTIAKASYSTLWYTVPDSTKIYIGTAGTAVNNATDKMVAYCFAAIPGYSAFGSYTGNGSSDGPFVFLGFRPRWIMLKRTDSTSDWIILDTSRNTYNVMNASLWADLSSAEGAYTICDYLSNGFKLRDASNGYNTSSGTYIYAAFAENPFQNALAR